MFGFLFSQSERWLQTLDIEYHQANIIINKIVWDNNLIAIISYLVILEIISIIRKKVITKMKNIEIKILMKKQWNKLKKL